MADVFGDARFHPILWVVQMLNFQIDRDNQIGITCCPNPKHEGQPRMTCLLLPKKNRWRLHRTKIESARWIIRECRLLPEWERFEQEYRHPKEVKHGNDSRRTVARP